MLWKLTTTASFVALGIPEPGTVVGIESLVQRSDFGRERRRPGRACLVSKALLEERVEPRLDACRLVEAEICNRGAQFAEVFLTPSVERHERRVAPPDVPEEALVG